MAVGKSEPSVSLDTEKAVVRRSCPHLGLMASEQVFLSQLITLSLTDYDVRL